MFKQQVHDRKIFDIKTKFFVEMQIIKGGGHFPF